MPVGAHELVEMTAIAIAVGILAQVVADRVRLPSIVFLLLFGLLVGPDLLGIIEPRAFGEGLRAIVTIAVAVILFEGGLQLHYVDVAAVGRAVRNLVTVGVVVTVLGASAAAHWIADLPWMLALLFGAIVSVTGPTVINPLLDRVKVKRRVDTVLRGEGILIDPIGAILAVVVLEWIATAEASVWEGLMGFVFRMGVGAVVGVAGGWLLGRVLRIRGIFPDELKNLVVLAWVLTLFAIAEAFSAESGLAAVVLAGMAVRRESIPRQSQLRRFKGELSVLFISILFILLSAYLPLETVSAVGWKGVMTVLVLMVVVRPLNVLASTWKSGLSWRERVFVMWISPRGVVAISIASFVALLLQSEPTELVEAGLTAADGDALLALVFLTIAITVVVQGVTAGAVSRLLGVHAEARRYAVVVGANRLGRTVGLLLREHGWEPLLIDTNGWQVAAARRAGLPALTGNSLDRRVLEEADLDEASILIATTTNQETNFLVSQLAKDEYHL
ncbi:MAG: cation:proton antiporter, partial [Gemmatimonadetes bacterium]|nr:cation:proton antiporter [Gemmatimonadota bacterium]